jgi:DNA-binding transcriptional LysR family regulator
MSVDAYTLDQFSVFVAIVDEGSFAAAARRMNRAQSAITYAIQRLEEQSGVILFDRNAYRPALTDAGEAMVPRARRILSDVDDWRRHVAGIRQGLEANITLAVASYVPAGLLAGVLGRFGLRFPFVELHILSLGFEAAADAVQGGDADLGLLIEYRDMLDGLQSNRCASIDLVAVAAPGHPLSGIGKPFPAVLLNDHKQLVLSNLTADTFGRDYGVHAAHRWRVNDINTKLELILAGVGWGSMPRLRVADQLASGDLVELLPDRWDGADVLPEFPLVIAHRRDKALGPAGRWLVEHFAALAEPEAAEA